MPYNIFSVDISKTSDTQGAGVVCTRNVYSGAPAVPDKIRTSIGSRITMTLRVAAQGGDTWANQTIIVTPLMFRTDGATTLPASTIGFTFNTGAVLAGVTYAGAWQGDRFTRRNGDITLTFAGNQGGTAIFTYTFYVASDMPAWPPVNPVNRFRFLSTSNDGLYLSDSAATAYNSTNAEMHVAIRIKSNLTPSNVFANATYLDEWRNEQRVMRLPICPTWYGRNAGSTAWAWRLNEFTATVGGTLIARQLFSATSNYEEQYDENFLLLASSLCAFGDNEIFLSFNQGDGVEPATITHAQLFLIRTDNVSPVPYFIEAYEYKEYGFVQDGTQTVPGGAFAGDVLADFNATSGTLRFNVDGTQLAYGACYRIGVILHDAGACDSWSVLTHELCADKMPQCYPDTTLELGNFCGHGEGEFGYFAPHERVSACVTFDVAPYLACMQAVGLDVSIENLRYVSLLVLNPLATPPVEMSDEVSMLNVFSSQYIPSDNTLITTIDNTIGANIEIENNIIRACAVLRLADLYDSTPNSPFIGNFIPFSWVIEFDVAMPNGTVERMRMRATHRIGLRDWGNYSNQESLSVTAWNGDLWPTKVPLLSLCNVEKIVFEVEKFGGLAGESVSLQTHFYTRPNVGQLNMLSGISGHDAGAPGDTSMLEQLTAPPVFDLTEFAGDTATFCVRTEDLPINQDVCVDVVTCVLPLLDCCPVLGDIRLVFYTRRSGNTTLIYCLTQVLRNAVNNADEPGAVSVIGTHDITGAAVNYIWQQDNVIYATLPSNTQPGALTWRFDIVSNFACEDGNTHTIRHEARVNIVLPTGNQGWILQRSDPAETTCIDIT